MAWRNGDGRMRDEAPGGASRAPPPFAQRADRDCRGGDRRARQPVERAAADRQQCPRQRDGKARGPGDLQSRPGRAAHPARSATSSSAIRRGPTSPRASPRSRCGSSGTAASRSTASSRAGCGCAAGWSAGRVSWGQVDKLLPPPSGKPFRFPDVSVDLADTTVALTSRYGVLGVAVEGAGNLTGGFKGRLAAASPRLVPGKCELVGMRASLAVAIGRGARTPSVRSMRPVSTARRAASPWSRRAWRSTPGSARRSAASTARRGWRSRR